MRARTAYVRWAAARLGGQERAAEVWDRAAGGDLGAVQEILSWIAASGVRLAPAQDRGDAGVPDLDSEGPRFRAALATLAELRGVLHPVQASQIAAAKFGDFEALPNGTLGVRWMLRRCGWAHAAVVDLTGAALEAFRVVVRYGRSAPPGPEDPMLALRGGARPWDARAVRHAIARGRMERGAEGAQEKVLTRTA